MGYLAFFKPGDTEPTESDYERALDNISAAIHGEPEPHGDLLPWPLIANGVIEK